MSQDQNNTEEVKQEEPKKGYTAVVIDTVNALQNDAYVEHMKEKGNPKFDEWRDYGAEILDLYLFLRNMNCDVVQILGREGTGKTVGVRTLDPDETLYLNADNKPLTFPKASKMYNSEKKNLHVPKDYERVKSLISTVITNKLSPKANGRLVVFVLAHTEDFKSSSGDRERLRVLGKMATKLNIEGGVVHSYYTWVDPDMSKPDVERYRLLTRNTGYNTGRTPMEMWSEDKIPNDFQLILSKIYENR